MDWTQVVTDPLGIAGFALALVFGVVSRVLGKNDRVTAAWIVPGAYALALLCAIGGLGLAYQRQAASVPASAETPPDTPPTPTSTAPSLTIGTIVQEADNGSAVAGVQGDVTIGAPEPEEEANPTPLP